MYRIKYSTTYYPSNRHRSMVSKRCVAPNCAYNKNHITIQSVYTKHVCCVVCTMRYAVFNVTASRLGCVENIKIKNILAIFALTRPNACQSTSLSSLYTASRRIKSLICGVFICIAVITIKCMN